MKTWHVVVLAASILAGSGLIAAALAFGNRYHYTNYPIRDSVGRVDTHTGAVEMYVADLGWVPVPVRGR